MQLPQGKTFVLAVTVCFDGQAVWLAQGRTDHGSLARGEYDACVGVPRVLDALERHDVQATWFVPGHSMTTWPDLAREIVARGHEVGAHGVYHERLHDMPEPVERMLMEHQLAQHQEILGRRPLGYRAPSGVVTDHTYDILAEFGFAWSSSIGGRDFEPYHPRRVLKVDPYAATVYGEETGIVEFPVSWYLEDWVAFEYVGGYSMGLSSTGVVLDRWKESLDYGLQYASPGVMTLVLHSQCISRPHHMSIMHEFLDYAAEIPGLWVAKLTDIYESWAE